MYVIGKYNRHKFVTNNDANTDLIKMIHSTVSDVF